MVDSRCSAKWAHFEGSHVAVAYDCVASCTAASTTMDAANVRCVRPQLMWQPAHDKRHTGHTRTHSCTLQPLRRLCNPKPGEGARDEVRLNGRSGNLSHYGTSSATQSLARVHEAKCRRSLAAHVHRSHRHSRPRRTRAIATPPREQSTLSDPHCISCARGACNIRSDAMCRASDWGTVNGCADWRRPPMSRLAFVDMETPDGVNPLRALMGAHLRCGCF